MSDRDIRDAFGDFPNVKETNHFAIKWGQFDDFSNKDIEVLADALEKSWEHEVETLNYPPPFGADTFKTNVYIGNTHEDIPDISNASKAYTQVDDQGYAYLVFSPRYLGQHDELQATAAHELFHAIQWHANADYEFGPTSAASWYWEATAVWMESEVYPEVEDYASHIASFLFYPEIALNEFQIPETGSLAETHAYGAFLFPQYLVEHGPGADIIRRSFTETQGESDPLNVLDRLLRPSGSSIDSIFFSFSEHNATLDYEHRSTYLAELNALGGYTSPESHRPSGTLTEQSTQWNTSYQHPPVSFAANYWVIDSLSASSEIEIESQEEGLWHAAVVGFDGTNHNVESIQWTGRERHILYSPNDEAEQWLVVAVTDRERALKVHPYRVRVRTDSGPTDTGTPMDHNCACTSSTLPVGWIILFGLPVALYSRRQ